MVGDSQPHGISGASPRKGRSLNALRSCSSATRARCQDRTYTRERRPKVLVEWRRILTLGRISISPHNPILIRSLTLCKRLNIRYVIPIHQPTYMNMIITHHRPPTSDLVSNPTRSSLTRLTTSGRLNASTACLRAANPADPTPMTAILTVGMSVILHLNLTSYVWSCFTSYNPSLRSIE
jgi:hypothetical protein